MPAFWRPRDEDRLLPFEEPPDRLEEERPERLDEDFPLADRLFELPLFDLALDREPEEDPLRVARDDERLLADERRVDLTSPSSIAPRQAPVSSSSSSM